MQSAMDQHRALNQAQTINHDRPLPSDGLNIRILRSDPNLHDGVYEQMSQHRENIPSLFPAPTAGLQTGSASQNSNPSGLPVHSGPHQDLPAGQELAAGGPTDMHVGQVNVPEAQEVSSSPMQPVSSGQQSFQSSSGRQQGQPAGVSSANNAQQNLSSGLPPLPGAQQNFHPGVQQADQRASSQPSGTTTGPGSNQDPSTVPQGGQDTPRNSSENTQQSQFSHNSAPSDSNNQQSMPNNLPPHTQQTSQTSAASGTGSSQHGHASAPPGTAPSQHGHASVLPGTGPIQHGHNSAANGSQAQSGINDVNRRNRTHSFARNITQDSGQHTPLLSSHPSQQSAGQPGQLPDQTYNYHGQNNQQFRQAATHQIPDPGPKVPLPGGHHAPAQPGQNVYTPSQGTNQGQQMPRDQTIPQFRPNHYQQQQGNQSVNTPQQHSSHVQGLQGVQQGAWQQPQPGFRPQAQYQTAYLGQPQLQSQQQYGLQGNVQAQSNPGYQGIQQQGYHGHSQSHLQPGYQGLQQQGYHGQSQQQGYQSQSIHQQSYQGQPQQQRDHQNLPQQQRVYQGQSGHQQGVQGSDHGRHLSQWQHQQSTATAQQDLPSNQFSSQVRHSSNQPGLNSNSGSYRDYQDIPVMTAPPVGFKSFTPVYDYFVDSSGKTCKVLRVPQTPQQTRPEYRCSPTSGRIYTVQVPVPIQTSPVEKHYVWECNPVTGERFRVEVPTSPQLILPNSEHHGNHLLRQPTLQPSGDYSQEQANQHLQADKVTGIVRLVDTGVTKKTTKPIDFAKKCSAKWAKKVTQESINLPLFTFGAVSELESSLSGRSEALDERELLAKLRHIKNFLEVCCLNSEATDFRGYGWTLAKDYALKVEGEVDQKFISWTEMSSGVQTNQLVLAQMDFPRPSISIKKAFPDKRDDYTKPPVTRERCRTYNTCKTENKCEYEVSNPDKKCILKHECTWCKTNLRLSHMHQELNCKKKN